MPPKPDKPTRVVRRSGTDYFAYIYAGVVFIGGIIGFIKAGSVMSMLVGTVMGTLLGIGARQVSANSGNYMLLFVLSAALMIVMGTRMSYSGKFFPTGAVGCISAVSFLRYGIRMANDA